MLRDVYHHSDYVTACARWENATAAWLDVAGGVYPVLLHRLPEGIGCDAQTPYGYGGPLFSPELTPAEKVEAIARAGDELRRHGAIAEFMRVHPHHLSPQLLVDAGLKVFQVRTNVECTLEVDDVTMLWSPGARRNIRKAQSFGLSWRKGESQADWDAFEALYGQTARRLTMAPMYHFDHAYFDAIRRVPCVELVIVEKGQTAVAAAIVFTSGSAAFYHLGASDFAYQQQRPNDLLYLAMASAAREAGCGRIVWGGGLANDPEDSLFRFKSHFGPDRVSVYGAGRVLDEQHFAAACARWEAVNQRKSSLFLKYRG